jgi:hypothetical protein
MAMTEARPRWATFSVKSHLDLDALTLDVLLYDALVFRRRTTRKRSSAGTKRDGIPPNWH